MDIPQLIVGRPCNSIRSYLSLPIHCLRVYSFVMKDAIIRLVSSMKVWTAIFGLITAIGIKAGFNVDPDVYWSIVGVVTALILGQGLTDHGKEAAKITAAASQPTTVVGNDVTINTPAKEDIK